ncbi:MAG: DUF3011 domain-containing protein [Acidobacteriota bacterium]|nr:DUF3011 domain-containing protein [Acidobacteriota bacterium]
MRPTFVLFAIFASLPLLPAQDSVRCSSDDGRRHYCDIDTSRGVRLSRQISGSACVQGGTWGYDQRGVWVDRGCRAEFVSRNAGGNYDPRGHDRSNFNQQSVRCNSDDERRHYCNIDTRGGVRLVNQISGSPCRYNESWGYDNNGIWVDHGCRAEFATGAGDSANGYNNQGYNGGYGGTVKCSSDDGNRHYCAANTSEGITLVRQISGTPCDRGTTWGVDRQGIWVDHGCRAEFQLGGR